MHHLKDTFFHFNFTFASFVIVPLLFLLGSCRSTGRRLEEGLPHGLLLQSKPGAVGTQPSCQPACTANSETGE